MMKTQTIKTWGLYYTKNKLTSLNMRFLYRKMILVYLFREKFIKLEFLSASVGNCPKNHVTKFKLMCQFSRPCKDLFELNTELKIEMMKTRTIKTWGYYYTKKKLTSLNMEFLYGKMILVHLFRERLIKLEFLSASVGICPKVHVTKFKLICQGSVTFYSVLMKKIIFIRICD